MHMALYRPATATMCLRIIAYQSQTMMQDRGQLDGVAKIVWQSLASMNWKCNYAVAAAFTKAMSGHAWFSA
jgi:hypothetical protein